MAKKSKSAKTAKTVKHDLVAGGATVPIFEEHFSVDVYGATVPVLRGAAHADMVKEARRLETETLPYLRAKKFVRADDRPPKGAGG